MVRGFSFAQKTTRPLSHHVRGRRVPRQPSWWSENPADLVTVQKKTPPVKVAFPWSDQTGLRPRFSSSRVDGGI